MQKVSVAILGATGLVGQTLVDLLINHPWFKIEVLAASNSSTGMQYQDVIKWSGKNPLPKDLAEKKVVLAEPRFETPLVFSALDSSVAYEIETAFLEEGYFVVSNSKNYRTHPLVPLIIPEVNANHIELIESQPWPGKIITNPNCAVCGLALALAPIHSLWGIEKAHICSLQSISGAGLNKLPPELMKDNLLPHIEGEEEKIENEPKKILGKYKKDHILPANLSLSASCFRVPISYGHMMNVSLKLKFNPSLEEIKEAWNEFQFSNFKLPSLCPRPIHYFEDVMSPQPKFNLNQGKGMAVSIGKLSFCPALGYKFNLLVHNLIRGAAGAALSNAELLVQKYPQWLANSFSTSRA